MSVPLLSRAEAGQQLAESIKWLLWHEAMKVVGHCDEEALERQSAKLTNIVAERYAEQYARRLVTASKRSLRALEKQIEDAAQVRVDREMEKDLSFVPQTTLADQEADRREFQEGITRSIERLNQKARGAGGEERNKP